MPDDTETAMPDTPSLPLTLTAAAPSTAAAPAWTEGNRLELLENGEEFFPRVIADIGAAQREVLIETFILFEDGVGTMLKDALVAAGRRGVRIELTVDGWGSPDLSPQFIGELTGAGVRVHIYDPRPKVLGVRAHMFRRLHRKIVVVDGSVAYIGGINYSDDHLIRNGPDSKQDYALRATGPIVQQIHAFTLAAIGMPPHRLRARLRERSWPMALKPQGWRSLLGAWWRPLWKSAGSAQALFVTRDNRHHRNDIEQHYRMAIRNARHEVIIANAYFFPGYRLMRELQRAARRGVAVHVLIQGKPDQWLAQFAATTLYHKLLTAGVQVYEYCDRPMHAKVATVDDEWATVGSSNLDPLSLYLNLECNIVARDRELNADLRRRMHHLMQHSCRRLGAEAKALHRTVPRQLLSYIAFHLMRRFPHWAGWLPMRPQLRQVHSPLRSSWAAKT